MRMQCTVIKLSVMLPLMLSGKPLFEEKLLVKYKGGAQTFPPIILLNVCKFVSDGSAGGLSLPNVGRINFQLHVIQTVEKE